MSNMKPTTPQAVSAFLRKSGFTAGHRTKLHEPAFKMRNGFIVRKAPVPEGAVHVSAFAAFAPETSARMLESYRALLETVFVVSSSNFKLIVHGKKD